MKPIGYVHSDFPTKFGVPRQSGIVDTRGQVVFIPPFNQPEAVRGLEEFSHIWLLWEFSQNVRGRENWSATVRPPRLGGNERMGVFATRSPFRPNPIGLSCVKLEQVQFTSQGPVLHIVGADLVDGTPIFDIKPYVAYSDCRPEASGGFSDAVRDYALAVEIPPQVIDKIPQDQKSLLISILSQDPRPSYQEDSQRIYGMEYAGMEIHFTVTEGILTVKDIILK